MRLFQDSIDVCVYEGERGCTDGNNLLGEFTITNIERAKRGVPKIDVTFELDANGILTVTACDIITKTTNKIVISNNRGRLSGEDIERMVEEARVMKAEDDIRIGKIEAKNQLESVVYQLSELARDVGKPSVSLHYYYSIMF